MATGEYASLLKRLKEGDLTSFDEIHALTRKSVFYASYVIFGSKEIAEDLSQETYLSFLEKKDKLSLDIDLPAYLVTMAKNKAFDLYKRMKKEHAIEEEKIGRLDDIHDSGLVDTIKKTLSEKEASVFLLKVLGEYSFKEISKMKGIPLGTLTWMYQEARKKLALALGE